MSTPSTATATIPGHHYSHYGYPRPSAYHSNGSFHSPSDPALHATSRSSNGYNNYPSTSLASHRAAPSSLNQVQHQTSMTTSQSSSAIPSGHSRERRPDWHDFYKNGPPKEIIVIDDDSPSPPRHIPPISTNGQGAMSNQYHEPVNKRRKTDQNNQPSTLKYEQSYSNTHIPHANTISSDRTTSLHTTAPTSLGSQRSGGSGGTYVEPVATGQKRKRVTRQQTNEEKKRKEIAEAGDAFGTYVPPAKPTKKSGEVYVQAVKDTFSSQQAVDDEDGHFIVHENSDLTERYAIARLLGQGTFGKVVEAFDTKKRSRCAIKIIRSVQKYRDASRIELRVLKTLSMNDQQNRNKCIHLRDCFDFRNHICIVTDLLGQSVFDFLKGNAFVPFPSSQIQNFARQLLTSVAFLHDLNLIHTDLKPENILLVNSTYQTFTYNRQIPTSSTTSQRTARQRRVLLDTEIRLIDFGSATFEDEYHSSVVSTRHYRAPEIILNLSWSYPCDIWSIGCILVEFYTGDALFQTHDNLEHLAMMEAVCNSRIETKLVRQVQSGGRNSNNSAAKYFTSKSNKLDYPNKETTKASKRYVNAMKSLTEIVQPVNKFNKEFLDLLQRIFVYDAGKRISAKKALAHPWFKEPLIDDGTEALRLKREKEGR